MYHHILAPLDGTEAGELVLPHVEALARAFQARVTLLWVTTAPEELLIGAAGAMAAVAPSVFDQVADVESEQALAEDYLRAVVRRLHEDGLDVMGERVQGDTAPTIVSRARELAADLIVMSTHGRGGLARLAFGSISDDVVDAAPCPVLLVRAPEGEKAPAAPHITG